MSFDFQLGHPCPHLIIEEKVELASDRQTMFLRGPVASMPSVRILINDSYYTPSQGSYSRASLYSSSQSPYRILRCSGELGPTGNQLTLATGAGSVTLSLPIGERVTLKSLKTFIELSEANDLVAVGTTNGYLSFTEKGDIGSESSIVVGGKGAAALGFTQMRATGKETIPPWALLAIPNQLPYLSASGAPQDNMARYPFFKTPLKGNPSLKVTYVTVGSQCPRCQGTLIENDYRFNVLGTAMTVSGANLLYQECFKAILTRLGSNPFHVSYGSAIMSRIGAKLGSAVSLAIEDDIRNSLSLVKTLQQSRAEYQQVSLSERLYQIQAVQVTSSEDDPTLFFADVVVSNMSQTPVSLNIAFSVPGATALAGSNGKSLGARATGVGFP